MAATYSAIFSGIGTAGTSHSIAAPTGVTSGQEITFVIQFWTNGAVPNQSTGLTAHGFTFKGRGFTPGGLMSVEVWSKVSAGSEPANYTGITTNISTTPYWAQFITSGNDPAGGTQTPQFFLQDAGLVNTHPSPSVTPTLDGSVVYATMSLGTGNTITPASPYTERFDVADGWAGGSYNQTTAANIPQTDWTSTDPTGNAIGMAVVVQPSAVSYNYTMRPNAALTLSGFSGAYTDIDEASGSPDAAYLEPV